MLQKIQPIIDGGRTLVAYSTKVTDEYRVYSAVMVMSKCIILDFFQQPIIGQSLSEEDDHQARPMTDS